MKQQLKTYVTLKNYQELGALETAIRLVVSPVNGVPLWNENIEKAILNFQRKLSLLEEKQDETFSFSLNTEEKENFTYAFNESKGLIKRYMSSECNETFNKLFA
jgi:hypothetical protein